MISTQASATPSLLRILGLGIVVLLSILVCLSLSLPAAFLSLFVLGVSVSRALLRKNRGERESLIEYILLGFLTPLAPAFGSGTLLLCSVFILFSDHLFRRSLWAKWALPFYFPAACWVFAHWLVQFDEVLLQAYFVDCIQCSWQQSLTLFANFLKAAPPLFYVSSVALLRLIVLLALVRVFSRCDLRRMNFFRGLLFALPIPLAALALQIFLPDSGLFANQAEYWSSLNRLSASFSDPNAFGIFAFLVAGLVLGLVFAPEGARNLNHLEQQFAIVFGALLIAIGPFAGSRSYFLGIALLALSYVFSRNRKTLLFAAAFCILSIAFFLTPVGEGVVSSLLSIDALPEGVRRVVSAFQLSSLSTTLYSRIVFFQIALSLWLDHLVVGVGYGGFHTMVVPYAEALSIPTGVWIDNANNFYLSILAELGVIGMIGLVLSLCRVQFKPKATWWHCSTVICFAVLLFFGPHLNFDEVAILFAGIAGSIVSIKPLQYRIAKMIPALSLVAIVILVAATEQSYGFYAWEKEGSRFFRWTYGRSAGYQHCDADNRARVQFQVVHPDLGKRPVRIGFSASGNQTKSYVITQFNRGQPAFTSTAEFECRDLPDQLTHLQRSNGIFWRMQVSNLWIPGRMLKGTRDPRALGIRVFSERPSEVLHRTLVAN